MRGGLGGSALPGLECTEGGLWALVLCICLQENCLVFVQRRKKQETVSAQCGWALQEVTQSRGQRAFEVLLFFQFLISTHAIRALPS